MRIMLDTNVLISMILFSNARFRQLLQTITREHTLVLSSFVVDELMTVAMRKFPAHKDDVDVFLTKLGYELVYTPNKLPEPIVAIRDRNDYPVLYTAIAEDVDILITGDKDFVELQLEKPEVMTPSAFLEKYQRE